MFTNYFILFTNFSLVYFIWIVVELCENGDSWKPLLLIIPLRLGLTDVNPVYINGLKKSFEIPFSVGIIGGRPNQAYYFIGYVGEEALYLDPHITQRCGSVGEKLTASEIEFDETYHTKYAARINFEKMDPSLALCFLCKTRIEFGELCTRLRSLLSNSNQPLFEITDQGQIPWQPLPKATPLNPTQVLAKPDSKSTIDDSEEDFEFIL